MSTAYDTVVYPNRCLPQTHPDRLGVLGRLFGLAPAAPDNCRMLELGCGDATNLLPLAYTFPRSTFVGVDLASTLISAGKNSVTELGLTNVELHQANIAEFRPEGSPFDYIVAHGVYSWVPAPVREAMMAICRARLAPHGIAYISYNCLPGGHARRMTRDIMRFHTRGVTDPHERVRQAMAVCRFVANSIEKPDTYRTIFKEQLEQIERHGGGHLYHDDLAEVNEPCYFHEFVAHAARHGLQFLSEADFYEMQDHAFSAEARGILGNMDDSRITREQYLDFIMCRRFRQTLLCHHEVRLREQLSPEVVESFEISSNAQRENGGAELTTRQVERFSVEGRGTVEVDHPIARAAFSFLRECWPATVSFERLFRESATLTSIQDEKMAEARRVLARVLLEAYRAGLVDFRLTPVKCVPGPSTRPSVWRFARWQSSHSPTVTTLRGQNLRVDDETGRHMVQLLDGTRDIEELRRAMNRMGVESGDTAHVHKRLQELGQLSLLEA